MDAPILYHYTSIETLYHILGVVHDEITLRATHASFMNDPIEYNYALSLLKESMLEYEKRNNINEQSKIPYLFEENTFFLDFAKIGGEPYLLSFSAHQDDLSMWRAYGKDGTGVSIGFDSKMLEQYCEEREKERCNILLTKCKYDYDKIITQLIKEWDKEYEDLNITEPARGLGFNNANWFFIDKFFFEAKDKSYIQEQEFRLCQNEDREDRIEFIVKGNLIVPFIEHKFKKSIIKKIIIGPSSNSEQVEQALKLFLRKFNYCDNNDIVERSKIQYRSV